MSGGMQVMKKLPTFAPHMEAVELTNALWACGKLEVAHDGVFEQLIPILINLCAARVPGGQLNVNPATRLALHCGKLRMLHLLLCHQRRQSRLYLHPSCRCCLLQREDGVRRTRSHACGVDLRDAGKVQPGPVRRLCRFRSEARRHRFASGEPLPVGRAE